MQQHPKMFAVCIWLQMVALVAAFPHTLFNQRYELRMNEENQIGKGTFGTVYRGYDRLNDEEVAIKFCKPPIDFCEHEYNVLSNQLAGKRGILAVRDGFHYNESYFIVSKLMNRHLSYRDAYRMGVLKKTIRAILIALRSLKESGVVHCDLKRNNVLVGSTVGSLVLADFGASRNASDPHDDMERTTWPYRAPEVFLWNRYSYASDIWSAGVLFVEMYIGKILFRPKYFVDWEQASTEIPQLWTEYLGHPPDWLQSSLTFYPIDRLKAGHNLYMILREEPLMYSFIKEFLHWQPTKRITVEQALIHPFLMQ